MQGIATNRISSLAPKNVELQGQLYPRKCRTSPRNETGVINNQSALSTGKPLFYCSNLALGGYSDFSIADAKRYEVTASLGTDEYIDPEVRLGLFFSSNLLDIIYSFRNYM